MSKNVLIVSSINLDTCKQELSEGIYLEKLKEFSIKRSNEGGWHSHYKLHKIPSSIFNFLAEEILEISSHLLKEYLSNKNSPKLKMTQLWANINKKNDWNSPHNHISGKKNRSEWSGVYYLDCENTDKDNEKSIGGELIIFHSGPKGVVEKHFHTPKNGQLIIFRSNALHMVTPNNTNKDRISIAFNLYEEL
ncbi:TIGR02466 family protein [Pseudoalteromonas sp. S558]|uniref:TIGR02466 family protein n=1 Tax=Pseudoalteromonas sp. S558 TaxID=2066515 RepID=UPI00110A41B3|nr:TIGR02466 family protein [Pseudoalteromonas sp. S558]TMO03611.1 hypothetical protein CWB66_10275 [Pseudoalteromonas sp. S558]